MKKLIGVGVLGLALLGSGALAHGPSKAQHGGVVQTAADLSFEQIGRAHV